MLNEYDKRQLLIMLERIKAFKSNKLYLHDLINDISALISVLELINEDWKSECRSWWCDLEVVYAVALDQNQDPFASTENTKIISSAVNHIELLVENLLDKDLKKIRIGETGLILQGIRKGWYIHIENDTGNTGGFLILQFPSLDANNKDGFNDWVETYEDLKAYFQKTSWEIKWLNNSME